MKMSPGKAMPMAAARGAGAGMNGPQPAPMAMSAGKGQALADGGKVGGKLMPSSQVPAGGYAGIRVQTDGRKGSK
jgi:hypothetical protein